MAFPEDWDYRQKIIIHGSSDGALTDYIMPGLTIQYDERMNSDFSDIRFSDDDGETQLDYSINSKTDEVSAFVIVKIPDIPADPDTKTVYLYYGNSEATDESSIEDTCYFFDDFSDLSQWTTTGVTVADGIVDIPNGGDMSYGFTISDPYYVEIRYKQVSSYRNRLYLTTSPTSNSPTGFDYGIFSSRNIYWNGNTGIPLSNDTWYRIQLISTASNYVFKVLSDDKETTLYTGTTSHINGLDTLRFLSTESANSHFTIDFVSITETEVTIPSSHPSWGLYIDEEEFKALLTVNDENYIEWLWQNEIEITGSVDGQLTDYPVLITVPYDNEFMRYDFQDIRFGTDYGDNLPFFLRQKEDGVSAEFFVKIPIIPASPDTTTIYLYAGNDQAPDRSDIFNTFPLGDDFNEDFVSGLDTSKWDTSITGGGDITLSNGKCVIRAALPMWESNLISKSTFGVNYAIGARVKTGAFGHVNNNASFGFDNGTTKYMKQYIDSDSSNFNVNNDGAEDTGADVDSTYTPTDYHVYEIIHKQGADISENIDFDDDVETSSTTITTTLPLRFHAYGYGALQYLYVDYVYVRPAIANEPALGELGTWSTSTHEGYIQGLMNIPYTSDVQGLLCIPSLYHEVQGLISIVGYGSKSVQGLMTIAGAFSHGYYNIVQGLLEINADASFKDVQGLISIGNVYDGSIEVKGKVLWEAGATDPGTGERINPVIAFELEGRVYV